MAVLIDFGKKSDTSVSVSRKTCFLLKLYSTGSFKMEDSASHFRFFFFSFISFFVFIQMDVICPGPIINPFLRYG